MPEIQITVTIQIPDSWTEFSVPGLPIRFWVDSEGGIHRLSSKGSLHSVGLFKRGMIYDDGHVRVRVWFEGGYQTVRVAPHIATAVHGPRPEEHQLDYADGNPRNLSPSNIRWIRCP